MINQHHNIRFPIKDINSVPYDSLYIILFCVPCSGLSLSTIAALWRHPVARVRYFSYRWSGLFCLFDQSSWECHTYCGTGHPIKMVISEDPLTLTPIAVRFAVDCFYDLGLSRLNLNTPPSAKRVLLPTAPQSRMIWFI